MTNVAVVKTDPDSVIEDYERLMNLANYRSFIDENEKIIIKLNLSWSLYYPACSTEPWQLEGVLRTLKNDGFDNVVAMENRTVVTNPLKGVIQNKWKPILDKYDVEFIPLMDVNWVDCSEHVKAELPAIREIFGTEYRIPEPFIGANVIHLPTMKTHGHTTMTGAMKNAFGGLITERRHHCHRLIHEILVDLLRIQREIHSGIFNVMDGTVCGNGKGPRTMDPVIKNYLLASGDPVAIDAICAKMMGFDPLNDVDCIRLADELGLGTGDVNEIEIIGEDIADVNFGFETGESPIVSGDKLFRKGAFSFLEPLVFHTPLFKLAIFASAFYHDVLWYQFIGKKRIRSFMKSEWGKVFMGY